MRREWTAVTPERIAELRRLCAAATPGPWEVWEGKYAVCVFRGSASPGIGLSVAPENRADAALIAAVRMALPELLDEVDTLNTALDEATRPHPVLEQLAHKVAGLGAHYEGSLRAERDELRAALAELVACYRSPGYPIRPLTDLEARTIAAWDNARKVLGEKP
jgi:hypothetical protein